MMIYETVRRHIADTLTADQRVLEAVEVQRKTDVVQKRPEVHDLVIRIERVLKDHVSGLEGVLASDWGDQDVDVKRVVKGAFTVLAGLYERLREQPLSEMIRSHYTALSHSVISAEILYTLAVASAREDVARLSVGHARAVTELLGEMRRLMPGIIASETGEYADDAADDRPAWLQSVPEAWRLDAAGNDAG